MKIIKSVCLALCASLVLSLTLSSCGYYDDSSSSKKSISVIDYIDNIVDPEHVPAEGPDYWSFPNSGKYFGGAESGYYITEADYIRLISNLSETEKNMILYGYSSPSDDKKKNHYMYEGSLENYVVWGGSCYGMSSTAVLVNQGKKTPADFNDPKKALKTTYHSYDIVSAINYYMWQQNLKPAQTAITSFMGLESADSNGEKGQISRLKEVASEKQAFLLAVYWVDEDGTDENGNVKYANYGHAIMGYGYETAGDKQWIWPENSEEGVLYNNRLLIYDCKHPNEKGDEYYIYFNDDGRWCYPKEKIYSTDKNIDHNASNNGKLGAVIANSDYINTVDYNTGETSVAYNTDYETSALLFVDIDDKYKIGAGTSSAEVEGLAVNDSTFGEGEILTSVVLNGKSDTLQVHLPQAQSSYNIQCEKNNLSAGFDVGNCFVSVKADTPGNFTFGSDGSVEVFCDNTPTLCSVQITSDASTPFGIEDCNSIVVDESGSNHIKIKPTQNGLVVDGEDLSNVNVSGYVYGVKQTIPAGSESKSIILKSSTNGLSISGDTNGDGNYTEPINEVQFSKDDYTVTVKDKTVAYTGKAKKIDAAVLSEKLEADVCYRYFTDADCKTEIAKAVKPGVYYVKAYALTKDGSYVESNVAKLTIIEKITLEKKSFSVKSSDLKQNKKVIQLKGKSDYGKITYKKTSGDKSITVNKKGKLSIKQGTKKGTYKVKVKMSIPKSEKTKAYSITHTIKIKIK